MTAPIPNAGTIFGMIADPLDGPRQMALLGPVVRIWAPPPLPRMLLVSDPDLIETVLSADFRSYRKDWYTRQLEYILGEGLVTSEGAHWKRQRRLMNPGFHRDRIASYAEVMANSAMQMAADWQGRRDLDIHAEMMALTLDVVAKTLFGADVGDDAHDVHRILGTLLEHFMGIGGSGIRIPNMVPTPGNRRARAALDELDALMTRLIASKRAEPGDDLLSMLIETTDEDGNGMDDQMLRDEALTLLVAGHETTALTLTFSFYLLAQNPDAEETLHAELDAVLGDRAPLMSDMRALPYTQAVITEAMRLYPPVWGIGREALQDTTLGDHAVLQGDQIFLSQWAMHRDPRFFDDPDTFRPERWLSDRKRPKYAYFPFGGGPRVCIGKRFAEMESILLLATLARRYSLRLKEGERLELLPSITIRPKHGLPMTSTARPVAHAMERAAK